MNDHNEYCATNFNSIDECDCERGQVRDLRSKLAIAVEALEEIAKYPWSFHPCDRAKEALVKIRQA